MSLLGIADAYSCDDGGYIATNTYDYFTNWDCVSGYQWTSDPIPLPGGLMITQKAEEKVVTHSDAIPGWRKAIQAGDVIPFTKYQVASVSFSCQPGKHKGNCVASYGRVRTKYHGDALALSQVRIPVPPESQPESTDRLLQSAWADVKSSGIDILTELAEAPETVKMFRGYVDAFRRRSDHVAKQSRKKGLRNGRKTHIKPIDAFGNAWMETRYGWRPLVGSAQSICDEWEDWKRPIKRRIRRRKSDTGSAATSDMSGVTKYPTDNGVDIVEGTLSSVITNRALVIAELTKGTVPGSISINPLATAWELVPASFCVDWFLNTSDLFRAHWPSSFLGQTAACISTKVVKDLTFRFNYKDWDDPGPYDAQATHGSFVYRAKSYDRTPTHRIPWNLSYKAKLSPAKVLDLGFIIRNALRGKLPKGFTRGL